MSRYVLGNCVEVMSGFPDKAVDLILTDPLYLVGFRDRSGRTLAGDKTDKWLQSACYEMYRVLKKDVLMMSFYGWNRVDRFMAAWKNAGFSVVATRCFSSSIKTCCAASPQTRAWISSGKAVFSRSAMKIPASASSVKLARSKQ